MVIVRVPSRIIPNLIMVKSNLHEEKDHIYFQMVIDLYGTYFKSPNVILNGLNHLDSVTLCGTKYSRCLLSNNEWFSPVFCTYIVKYCVDK